MLRFLPLLAVLILAACVPARTPSAYLSRGEIPVMFRDEIGVAGRWDPLAQVIYLSAETNGYTLAHEMAHASDTMGISFEDICLRVGEVPDPYQMRVLRLVRAEARRIGGRRSGWRALYRICGAQGVYHTDILADIRAMEGE